MSDQSQTSELSLRQGVEQVPEMQTTQTVAMYNLTYDVQSCMTPDGVLCSRGSGQQRALPGPLSAQRHPRSSVTPTTRPSPEGRDPADKNMQEMDLCRLQRPERWGFQCLAEYCTIGIMSDLSPDPTPNIYIIHVWLLPPPSATAGRCVM